MTVKLPGADSFGQRPSLQPGSSVAGYQVGNSSELAGRQTMEEGQQMAQVAGQIGQMAKQFEHERKVEQDRVDTMRAEDAFTQLREQQLDLTIGEQNGFARIKGADAVTKPMLQDYGKRFGAAEEAIASTLGNDDQKRKFKQRSNVAGLQFQEDLMRHLIREGDVYAKEVFEGTVKTEIRSATSHWQEPAAIALSIERVNAAIRDQADRNGWAPEYAEAVRLEQNGRIHSAIVGQALATGNYKYAEDWYNKHQADIDKPTAEAVQRAVEGGTQKQLYAGYSADFLANRNSAKGLDLLEQKIAADQTIDPTRQNALLGRVMSRRETLVTQSRVAQERYLRGVERQINKVNSITLSGYEPTPEQMAPILNAAKGTELEGDAKAMVANANATRQFRLGSPQQQTQWINDLETQARKDPTKFDISMVSRFKSIQQAQQTAVKEDGITFAVRQGLVEAGTPATTPLDWSKPEQLSKQLSARFELSRSISQRYPGAGFKPLTQGEQESLGAALKTAAPAQKRELFATIANATQGDRNGYKAIMGQLAPDDPVTSMAGILANKETASAKGSAVADLILQGQAILHPNKKQDGTPSAAVKILPPDKDMKAAFQGYERDAFAGYPAARGAYYQTAEAIYAAKAAKAGNYSQILDSGLWEESIKLATGGIDKYNGKSIMLPWGQDYGQFKDGLKVQIDNIVTSGRLADGVTVGRLRDMPLEMAGDGRYVFKAGDGVLVDKNNKPVFVDFNDSSKLPVTEKDHLQAIRDFKGRSKP